ncbi:MULTISPECIES: class III lanthipeptide [Stigmatella]|nr:class III lanthipeptide [Stigmatella aurantiaca]
MKKVLALQQLAPKSDFDPLSLSSLVSISCCKGTQPK